MYKNNSPLHFSIFSFRVQQSKTAKNKVHDDLYEMSKPLARYKDDTDLDQMLKDRDRAGDPMLAFVQKKKVKQDRLAGKKGIDSM